MDAHIRYYPHNQPCHINTIFYFFSFSFYSGKMDILISQILPQNYWSFINSKHLLGIMTLLTHIFFCPLFVNSQELLLLHKIYNNLPHILYPFIIITHKYAHYICACVKIFLWYLQMLESHINGQNIHVLL